MPKKKNKKPANRVALKKGPLLLFSDKGTWDSFFTLGGSDDPSEWYTDWSQLRTLLPEIISRKSPELDKLLRKRIPNKTPEEVRILVPGCGNSRLSEHMYDHGYRDIMNVDFSKVVIESMLKKHVRERPEMKWRVMDMTELQFGNESFDVVLDKGGLDSLMELEIGPRLGNLYLSEVKRVLADGGKFICLNLAESHVIDLLFHKFRFGWKMSIHTVDQIPNTIFTDPAAPPSTDPALQTFVVVVEKDCPTSVSDISTFLDKYSVESCGDEAREFHEALEKERKFREEYLTDENIVYKLEDLRLGAKGNISVMIPGRRLKIILGEPGVSKCSYKGILLDAKPDAVKFKFRYAVFIVPQLKYSHGLYTSEDGQWIYSSNTMVGRLLMVFLDSSNSILSSTDVQVDLSPLVLQLTPAYYDHTIPIPFIYASDGIQQRESVHQVMSELTGSIVVEDVVYETKDIDCVNDKKHRRLIFDREGSLVQSEALLSKKGSGETVKETKQEASSCEVDLFRNFLTSPYHNVAILGMMLTAMHLCEYSSHGKLVKVVVLGLGAGLLPMCMRNVLPYLKIEVVELDPVVLNVARDYFGFKEDDYLKVHIADAIQFVKAKAKEKNIYMKVDVLVVDVGSSDISSGLTCPGVGFVEESFILAAKESLSEHGLLILNVITSSSSLKIGLYSRLKKVFGNIYRRTIEAGVNEVVFALKTDSPLKDEQLSQVQKSLTTTIEWNHRVLSFSHLVELLY